MIRVRRLDNAVGCGGNNVFTEGKDESAIPQLGEGCCSPYGMYL